MCLVKNIAYFKAPFQEKFQTLIYRIFSEQGMENCWVDRFASLPVSILFPELLLFSHRAAC